MANKMRRPRMVSAREIVGKRIVALRVERFRARDDDRGIAHDPEIELDDGSVLRFMAEETDYGTYGIFIGRGLPPKRKC